MAHGPRPHPALSTSPATTLHLSSHLPSDLRMAIRQLCRICSEGNDLNSVINIVRRSGTVQKVENDKRRTFASAPLHVSQSILAARSTVLDRAIGISTAGYSCLLLYQSISSARGGRSQLQMSSSTHYLRAHLDSTHVLLQNPPYRPSRKDVFSNLLL